MDAMMMEATAEDATMEIVSVGRGPVRGYCNRLIPSRLMRCRKCGATTPPTSRIRMRPGSARTPSARR